MSLFCIIMPKYINALVRSWHKFINFVPVEVRLLHLQPCTEYHFHFLIIMELTVSTSSAAVSKTNRCMIQKFPVKGLQCALSGIALIMRTVFVLACVFLNAFVCNLIWHYFLHILNFSGYCLCGSAER